jgi:hypothetical protein
MTTDEWRRWHPYSASLRDALCPEAAERAAMTDSEFWAHVYPQPDPGDDRPPDDQEIAEYELEAQLADSCPECGVLGACSYDAEGRALIHVTTGEPGD